MKNLLKTQNSFTKLVSGTALTLLGSLVLTGCSSTLSNNINNQGHSNDIIFPEIENAWQKQGQFPNIENLSKIKTGMVKDELYYLIGRPHFEEGVFNVREWDYIMKFYREDKSVKICQYKVLFDENYLLGSDHWLPADCAKYAIPKVQEKIIIQQQPVHVIQEKPEVIREKLTLDADALFAFNEYSLDNMLPKGRMELEKLINKLRQFSLQGDIKVYITGHTDYKGSSDYNYDLSNRRANTVLMYLANNGISRSVMSASGVGEDFPIKTCSTNMPSNVEIDCLQENRRVEIEVFITKNTRLVSTAKGNAVEYEPQVKNARYVQSSLNTGNRKNQAYQQPEQQKVVYEDARLGNTMLD